MNNNRASILRLLKNSTIISGEQIAQTLSISRTAVWKHIQTLKKKGYCINSVPREGYELLSSPNVSIEEELKAALSSSKLISAVHYFHSIDSTNSYAKQILKQNAREGTIVISDIQTKGRGRKQRNWVSPEGGLWFSILLKPQIPIQHAMIVTMAASLAVSYGIMDSTGLLTIIKWPNDLLIGGKKICGILTEIDAELDRINSMVMGIGINVNNPLNEHLKNNSTTLEKELNKHIPLASLLHIIITHLEHLYGLVIMNNFESIRVQWLDRTDTIGKTIRVHDQDHYIEGTAFGITEKGHLILKTSTGTTQILSGNIEYIN